MRISDWSSDVCSSDLHLGVVVEHLLEMRHQPFGVGGVPGEAAAQMIVYAALAHAGERGRHRLPVLLPAGPLPGPPQQGEDPGLGELRREIGRASCRERVCQYV